MVASPDRSCEITQPKIKNNWILWRIIERVCCQLSHLINFTGCSTYSLDFDALPLDEQSKWIQKKTIWCEKLYCQKIQLKNSGWITFPHNNFRPCMFLALLMLICSWRTFSSLKASVLAFFSWNKALNQSSDEIIISINISCQPFSSHVSTASRPVFELSFPPSFHVYFLLKLLRLLKQ